MTTTARNTRRPWQPTDDDRLIFKWVKLDGKSQGWVASALGLNQSTVSRVLQRYERWQAHAKDREDGRLDHTERLRAQRWLTYERNEKIINSCLRIADEMEGFVDTSQSTISRPLSEPSQERTLRTVHSTIDRTSIAARFLRLAHRINMDQLKLAERDPAPLPIPLTPAELADLQQQAAEDHQERHEARQRSQKMAGELVHGPNWEDAKVGRSGPDRPEVPDDAAWNGNPRQGEAPAEPIDSSVGNALRGVPPASDPSTDPPFQPS
jgi:hypothetical protein